MKRNMKKIASVLLVAMLALCLTACGGGKDNGGAVEIADADKFDVAIKGNVAELTFTPDKTAKYDFKIKFKI